MHAISKFFVYLYTHGTNQLRVEVKMFLSEFVCPILTRVVDNLIEPLNKEGALLATESDKMESLLIELDSYIAFASLAVKMLHIDAAEGQQQDSANSYLQCFVKKILTKTVQIT